MFWRLLRIVQDARALVWTPDSFRHRQSWVTSTKRYAVNSNNYFERDTYEVYFATCIQQWTYSTFPQIIGNSLRQFVKVYGYINMQLSGWEMDMSVKE